MATNAMYDPEIRINNETFSIVPGSASYISGAGESSVRAQSSGNGEVTMVYSEDVTTKIAKFKVSVYATAEKLKKIKELKTNKANNYVTINDIDVQEVLTDAAIINDPEFNFSNDGEVEIEFAGKPNI